MTRLPFPRAASVLVTALVLAGPARAIDKQTDVQVGSNKSLQDYLSDLEGDSDPDRLFAARVMRGELARALRTERTARTGSLALLDAQALLVELTDRLPRGCKVALRQKNTVAPCADIYALLEETSALPELRATLAAETRKGVQRHLADAIAALEALSPPPVVAPAVVPPSVAPPAVIPEPTSAP